MANFGQLILTNLGTQLQYKAQSGYPLKLKRIAMGSGRYSGNIPALTKLVTENVSVDISKGYMQNNAYIVEGFFSNESLQTGFQWREIGIFAEEDDGSEILYCYANAGETYDYIPATEDERYSKYIRIAIAIGNATNVSIVEQAGLIYVDTFTFAQKTGEIESEIDLMETENYQGYKIAQGSYYAGIASDYGIDIGAINGKSEQATTEGYNLIGLSDVAEKTNNGITYSITDDVLTLNGTWNGTGILGISNVLGSLKDAGKYTLKVESISGTWTAGSLGLRQIVDGVQTMYIQQQYLYPTATKDFPENEINTVEPLRLYATVGSTFNNFKCRFLLYKNEGTELEYEPYSGHAPSPSPDYPQEVESFGDEAVNFHSHGFQLFDASKIKTVSKGGATVTNNGDGSFTISGSGTMTEGINQYYQYSHAETLAMVKSGKLTLLTEQTTYPYLYAQLRYNNGTSTLGLQHVDYATQSKEVLQSILDDETCILRIGLYGNVDKTIVPGTVKPMLYQDGDGTWEWFKEPKSTAVSLAEPLRSLPNGVCDTYKDGVITRRVGVLELDGDENWFLNADSVNPFRLRVSDAKIFVSSQNNAPNIYCDKFIPAAWNDSMNETKEQLVSATIDTVLYFRNNKVASDLTAWTAWLASNPVTVLYELATPTTETVTLPTIPSYALHTAVHHDSNVDIGEIEWYLNNGAKTAEHVGALPIINYTGASDDLDTILKSGIHKGLYVTNVNTLNTPYKHGVTTETTAFVLSFANSTSFGIQYAFVCGEKKQSTFIRTMANGTISDWGTGFLPLAGGKITDRLYIERRIYPGVVCDELTKGSRAIFQNYGYSAVIDLYDVANDDANKRSLSIRGHNHNLYPTLKNAAVLIDKMNSAEKMYNIFGEYNKPTGSYIGNGSATSRKIETAGIGNAILIWSEGKGSAFINPGGAICKKESTVSAISGGLCMYKNGVLTIMTSDEFVNANGTTYYYQVL